MESIRSYFGAVNDICRGVVTTDRIGQEVEVDEAFEWCVALASATHAGGHKLMFVGNGGSAAIASHMAIDYSKNGGMRSLAFNDGASLTCLANDLGYENVFAKQIELHAFPGDVLFAISSSGRSASILRAVDVAVERGCKVITFSGFTGDNPLRRLGDLNMYVHSTQYGYVEISHLMMCHAILDVACGLKLCAEPEVAEATIGLAAVT